MRACSMITESEKSKALKYAKAFKGWSILFLAMAIVCAVGGVGFGLALKEYWMLAGAVVSTAISLWFWARCRSNAKAAIAIVNEEWVI